MLIKNVKMQIKMLLYFLAVTHTLKCTSCTFCCPYIILVCIDLETCSNSLLEYTLIVRQIHNSLTLRLPHPAKSILTVVSALLNSIYFKKKKPLLSLGSMSM